VWAVVRTKDKDPLFADAHVPLSLIAETRDHTLFSNQP